MENAGEITQLLELWSDGDEGAFDRLLPVVYQELHKLAAAYLRRERTDHTLQATALVNEVYLRLSEVKSLDAKGRSHFFAVAARAMRRILVDHARSQKRDKRVGAHLRQPLEEAILVSSSAPDHVIAVHEALEELGRSYPRHAELVELRFFGGFSETEAAEILEVSRSTLSRDWRFARLWLYRHLENS